jgi:hypothetical protein
MATVIASETTYTEWSGAARTRNGFWGYYFPTFRADVLASSATAAPVVGDLLTYTVAPLHAIRTCAVCREGSGRSPADRFGPGTLMVG